jgi:hypothetical protein
MGIGGAGVAPDIGRFAGGEGSDGFALDLPELKLPQTAEADQGADGIAALLSGAQGADTTAAEGTAGPAIEGGALTQKRGGDSAGGIHRMQPMQDPGLAARHYAATASARLLNIKRRTHLGVRLTRRGVA